MSIPLLDMKRILKAQKGDWIIYNLIKIEHPDMASPLRYVRSALNLTHDGEVYQARRFTIAHPTESREGASGTQITIGNTDNVLGFFLRSYTFLKRATLTLWSVSSTDYDNVMVGPFEYLIKQGGIMEMGNDSAVVLTLGYEDTLSEQYPAPTFDEHYNALYGNGVS